MQISRRVVAFAGFAACIGCKRAEPPQVIDHTGSAGSAGSAGSTVAVAPGADAAVAKADDLEVIELAPKQGKLRDQLAARRKAAGDRVFIVETTADWCKPCQAVTKYLHDPAMTQALAGVTLVRVDFEQFGDALESCGLPTEGVPFFSLIDRDLHVTDAIASDEWGADIPANMAPVLAAFVHGTLAHRRHPWHRPPQ